MGLLYVAASTRICAKEKVLNIPISVLWRDMVRELDGSTSVVNKCAHGTIRVFNPILEEIKTMILELCS